MAGYEKVKVSDFDGYYFEIEILVNNVKTVVKLDTGNPYDLVLTEKEFGKVKTNTFAAYQKGSPVDNAFASVKTGNYSDSVLIKSAPKVKRDLLGIGFMKHYNWILDYKKGSVYIRKISDNHPRYFPDKAFIEDNKLVYGETYQKEKKGLLGKEIISVGKIKVKPENVCEMQTLLNNTENWEKLNVVFK